MLSLCAWWQGGCREEMYLVQSPPWPSKFDPCSMYAKANCVRAQGTELAQTRFTDRCCFDRGQGRSVHGSSQEACWQEREGGTTDWMAIT